MEPERIDVDAELDALDGHGVFLPRGRHPWRPGDDPSREPSLRDLFFWHFNGSTDWIPEAVEGTTDADA